MHLEKGTELDAEGKYGRTPLFYAAHSNQSEIAELLLKADAETDKKAKDERTPLMAAARKGSSLVVRNLLGHEAKINAEDNRG